MGSEVPEARLGPFGDYQLVRRIAVGGMAEIFEARSRREHAPADTVVLKVLLPQLARDPEFVRLLRDEARIGTMLRHPNLVRLFELGQVGNQTYLAMELVDGIPLSDLLCFCVQRQERLPIGVTLFVIDQVLEALAYAHDACDEDGTPLRIVHRDVTPHNVLLSRTGEVRLSDFGIARSTVRDGRTRTGVIKGKVRYLAPEQVTASAIDARTDLYAVGLMLFEMATGTHFLEGETELELLRLAEDPPFRAPSSVVEEAACVDVLVRKALGRFPEERYGSAPVFLRALRGVRADKAGPTELAEWVERVMAESADTCVRVSGLPSSGVVRLDENEREARDSPAGTRARNAVFVVGAAAAVVLLVLGGRALLVERRVADETPDAAVPATSLAVAPEPSLPERDVTVPDATFEVVSVPALPSAEMPSVPRSSPTVRVPATSSTAVPAVSAAPAELVDAGPSAEELALRRRLIAARSSLSGRGILLDDLSPEQRALLRSAQGALDADRVQEAAELVVALERELGGVRVDGPFVQRKMARVDAALLAARKRGDDVSGLQALSAQALQAYMEGQYAKTNGLLNTILGRLAPLRGSGR